VAWLRARVRGEIILPESADYAADRDGFNPRYDPHPAAIIAPRDPAELRACLKLAHRTGLSLVFRGGGHSFSGRSNSDGLVIDMRHFDTIAIDGTAVTVGAGCRQSALRDALAAAGLHLPLGDSPQVAIGGFMQGGGYGHTARLFGMNCDHVIAVTMMLADGTTIRADATTNADLFWAVRGGAGAGLGALLDLTYRAHPAPPLAADSLAWRVHTPAERARAAEVLALIAAAYTGPSAPGTALEALLVFGNPRHPGPWLFVDAMHRGNARGLARALAPLRALGPVADPGPDATLRPGSVPAMSRQSRYLARPPAAADWLALLALQAEGRPHHAVLYFTAHGDAIDAVPRESCAFIHRATPGLLTQDVFWSADEAPDDALALQSRVIAAAVPWCNGRSYQNFSNEALQGYREAYWGEAFPALLAVRRKYDPKQFFAGPQDISRAPGAQYPPPLWPPEVADALSRAIAA
jgi:FAD/FMN-containing dehydrogenase